MKVAKGTDFESGQHKKKTKPCVVMDVYQTYCGKHFAIYTNIGSLLYTLNEYNVIHQLYLKKNLKHLSTHSVMQTIQKDFLPLLDYSLFS